VKRKKKEKFIHPDKPWTEWEEASVIRDGLDRIHPVPQGQRHFVNNHYQVILQPQIAAQPFGMVIWLSIKRQDRRAIHDWRDLQRIKNELVGPEVEAVELYPSESRLVDTSNQYHLWCFVNGLKLPFGYQDRLVLGPNVSTDPAVRLAKQRPFRGHDRPNDVMTPEQAEAMLEEFKRTMKTPLKMRSRTSQHDGGSSEQGSSDAASDDSSGAGGSSAEPDAGHEVVG
jgi:hypothetical protein